MAKAKVFISGMDALGVEIAKNVALAGVKQLTVHDTQPARLLDLSNYYLTEDNVKSGENRAVASAKKLNELNR
jgi:ubiquitin-activating enzyme E1